MKERTLLIPLACLVLLAACGGGSTSLPTHWSSYAQTGLLEQEQVRTDPENGRVVCNSGEDPETVELFNPVTGTTDTYYCVAVLELGCRPGLGLAKRRALNVGFSATGPLWVAIDDDVTDGPNDFEMIHYADPYFVLAEWDVNEDDKYVFVPRQTYVQVYTSELPLVTPGTVTIEFAYQYPDRSEQHLGSETYSFRNCGGEPEPDPSDPPDEPDERGNPVWNFSIPPEARDPFSLTAVTEKDPLAVGHAVIPDLIDDEQKQVLAKVTDEITSFISGLAPQQLAVLARTIDRQDGLLVSDSPLLVPDDVPYPDGFPGRWSRKDLFWLDMVTGDVFRLTRHREEGFNVTEARWSPSGDRIAYLLADWRAPSSGVTSALWLWDRETGELSWLADDAQGSVGWSPDGATIIYTSPEGDLRAIDADGADERLLLAKGDVHTSLALIRYPDWHPTLNQIVFVGMSTGNLRGGPVYLYDLDADSVLQLTDGMNDGLLPKESAEDQYPVWSPDGKYIAFVRRTASSTFAMLKILNVEGEGPPIEIAETREYRNLDW